MFKRAINDLRGAIKLHEVWTYLAINDVATRYRNTLLGPLWNSAYLIGQAVALAVVFGAIFQSPMTKTMPYILSGMTAWILGPGAILDSSGLLVSAGGTIKSQNLPYLTYPLRAALRNLILFGHNVLAFVVVVPFFGHIPWMNPLFLLTAPLIALITVPYGMLIGMACARFRDIGQFLQNFTPILFFMTPVFWNSETITGPRQALFHYNPFYYLLNLIRKPMLGLWPNLLDWCVAGGALALGWALVMVMIGLFRPKIPHWV